MIQGLRTVIYPVSDLAKASAWYSAAFGREPYFNQPYYVGYAVGGFELGLVPDGEPGRQGCVAYWGVENIDEEVSRMVSLGATVHKAVQEVGEGIRVAELLDPDGNQIGLIQNPQFDPAAVR